AVGMFRCAQLTLACRERLVFHAAAFRFLRNGMRTFAELNFPGRLIAVEGLDGSGKSTQIYLLKRWLELQSLKVYFSEWNSSELVKAATSTTLFRCCAPATLSFATAIFSQPLPET